MDIRLQIGPKDDLLKTAVYDLTCELPLAIPFGKGEKFSLENAATLASTLAVDTKFSMRKIKRILLKVEIALRCHADVPLDVSLLVYLAFKDEAGDSINTDFLPRSFLTPERAEQILKEYEGRFSQSMRDDERLNTELNKIIYETAPELLELEREQYNIPDDRGYLDWALVFKFLAPHYIPSHRDILNAVASVIVQDD